MVGETLDLHRILKVDLKGNVLGLFDSDELQLRDEATRKHWKKRKNPNVK